MDIQLVVHCWRYGKALAYQMSSLILDPPKCSVEYTVYCNEEDESTMRTLMALHGELPPSVCLIIRHLPKPKLFRRAIGRNEACLGSLAKHLVLLTDVDYCWSGTALDELLANYEGRPLCYPHHYMKQKDHELGDACLALQEEPKILALNPDEFESCRIGKAIGGIQVVSADLAREHGYLNGTRWMQPYTGDHFACCRCDRAARVMWDGLGYKFEDIDGAMPWRIRHSVKGRCDGTVEN